jgi:hypothetical protein
MYLINTTGTHYTALSCIAQAHHIDLFALTETWIFPSTTSAELLESKPVAFLCEVFVVRSLHAPKINT